MNRLKYVARGALVLAGAAVATAAMAATPASPFGRDALRTVVAACLVSKSTLGLPFPCADVRLTTPDEVGYAVIRAPGAMSEYLLSPLAGYDGIESPELRQDAATGLWQAAWNMRSDVTDALGHDVPRTGLALAVNAVGTRTQDQFHIHLDCLRASVGKVLSAKAASIGPKWKQFASPLRGRTYWARSIDSADLTGVNIPRLIDEAPPAADHKSAHATLAVVGARLADGSDGFYLLANWQNASGERLLDHRCRQG